MFCRCHTADGLQGRGAACSAHKGAGRSHQGKEGDQAEVRRYRRVPDGFRQGRLFAAVEGLRLNCTDFECGCNEDQRCGQAAHSACIAPHFTSAPARVRTRYPASQRPSCIIPCSARYPLNLASLSCACCAQRSSVDRGTSEESFPAGLRDGCLLSVWTAHSTWPHWTK